MKRNLIPMAAAVAMLSFAACNNDAGTTSTEDSTSSTVNANTSEGTAGATAAVPFDENASYVDLKSGKTVKLKKDPASGYVRNQEDNSEVWWYFNPVTNDTFDRSGNVVNHYLIKGADGNYALDEERWKTKMDEDGDFKAKDGEESKVKVDGTEPESKIKTEDTKEKVDENSYKMKTKDGKLKVNEGGKVKVESN